MSACVVLTAHRQSTPCIVCVVSRQRTYEIKCYIINYDKIYALKTHRKVEYVFAAGGRKITFVLTGFERIRGKASTKITFVLSTKAIGDHSLI